MKKFIALFLIVVFSLAANVAGKWYVDNRLSNFGKQAELYVYPDMSSDQVYAEILEKCQVKKDKSLQRAFEKKHVADYLQPGHYTISPSNSSVYVARMLNNAWQSPVKLTLSGNLRIKGNIASKIATQMLLDSAQVMAAFNDDSLLSSYGFSSKTLFSLIQPDTYNVYWTDSMQDVLDKQKKAWDAFWTPENDAKAKALGLSRQDVSTLASIVKGETNNETEMPKVAGVYLNRLAIGMRLQADPTVAYCFDYKLNRVLLRHLEYDSPYNTYRHEGLPPGPICVPTRACLEAVLNADYGAPSRGGSGNLYFCANPDFSGTHVFAKTLAEHGRNAAAFQAELNRRARERKNK